MRRARVIAAAVLLLGACGTGRHGAEPRSPSPSSSSTTVTTIRPTPTTTARPTTTTTTRPSTTTTAPITAPTTTPTTVSPSHGAVVVRQGNIQRTAVALTFDAGSDAGNTAAILDMLAARGIRASFSLTGDWARANPELVRRIARAGHLIINHSDTHRSFTGYSTNTRPLSASERVSELTRADATLAGLTGKTTRPWFRPPYGDIDTGATSDVARAGYRYILLWTLDSLGWKGIAPSEVAARTLQLTKPGSILLFHVGSASTDAAALPRILDGLQSRGYGFVRVDEPGFIGQ